MVPEADRAAGRTGSERSRGGTWGPAHPGPRASGFARVCFLACKGDGCPHPRRARWPGAGPGDALCPQVGAFGNGTALAGSAEVQLVAFLSCFGGFPEAAARHGAALRLLRSTLWTCQDLLDLGLDVLGVSPGVPDALAFTVQTKWTEEPVTVTVVPAYRALGKGDATVPGPGTGHARPSPAALGLLTPRRR